MSMEPIHPSVMAWLKEVPKKMVIGGQPETALSGQTFLSINPSDGRPLAEVAQGGVEDVDRAVAAARGAAEKWAATAPAERERLLRRFAALIKNHWMFRGILGCVQ